MPPASTRNGRSTLRDDVFAVNAYCPITDLGNADIAYEWLYTALGTRAAVGANHDPRRSAEIAAKFPAYQKSLRLRNADGSKLTADTMLDEIEARGRPVGRGVHGGRPGNVIPDLGEDIDYTAVRRRPRPTYINDWIDVDNAANKVVSIDMRSTWRTSPRRPAKPAPAFDQTGVTAPFRRRHGRVEPVRHAATSRTRTSPSTAGTTTTSPATASAWTTPG